MNQYILDEKTSVPVLEPNILKWGKWHETANRHIAATQVSDSVEVSTVFLGLDHSFGRGEPLLYETMIFGGKHDKYQERYCTADEARTGHETAIQLASEG